MSDAMSTSPITSTPSTMADADAAAASSSSLSSMSAAMHGHGHSHSDSDGHSNGYTVSPSVSSPLPSALSSRSTTATSPPSASATLTTSAETTWTPYRSSMLNSSIVPPPYMPNGARALCGISFRAFILGAIFGLCVNITLILLYIDWTQSSVFHDDTNVTGVGYLWRISFFVAALALFHYLEFDMTARYNTLDAKIASFLLFNNGWAYNVAHMMAIMECSTRWALRSGHGSIFTMSSSQYWNQVSFAAMPHIPGYVFVGIGLTLVVLGQVSRSLAMKTAGRSFNHIVQSTKKSDHVLITDGIYRWSRHPSYFGFFWWGLGTQLVLGNYICFPVYAIVLWNFFATRITSEEEHLVAFFGQAYVDFRERTPVLIPFV